MTTLFPPDGVTPLRISELTHQVKARLASMHPHGIWVMGEVSNLARPASGHLYLKLKDAESQIGTVIWRSTATRMRFDLHDGMEVICRGRLDVFVPRGEYQLQVEEIQPRGIGPLELAFRQLKEKLSARGWFHPARKRPLPRFPLRAVLITSPSGAAVRDMLEVFQRRWPALDLWIRPVPVQGDGAAVKIAEAIAEVNGLLDVDVIIVARGGGSLEDLWSFNEEVVAGAIFASRIPVVSGIGHETDLTIADMVADVRALTPTEAAERVAPNRAEIQQALDATLAQLQTMMRKRLVQTRQQLADLAGRRCFRAPMDRVHEAGQRVDDLAGRVQRGLHRRLDLAKQRLQALAARLESLSPLNVLARGYSLTRKAGEVGVLRDARDVRPGDRLETRLRHGRVISVVEETSDRA